MIRQRAEVLARGDGGYNLSFAMGPSRDRTSLATVLIIAIAWRWAAKSPLGKALSNAWHHWIHVTRYRDNFLRPEVNGSRLKLTSD